MSDTSLPPADELRSFLQPYEQSKGLSIEGANERDKRREALHQGWPIFRVASARSQPATKTFISQSRFLLSDLQLQLGLLGM